MTNPKPTVAPLFAESLKTDRVATNFVMAVTTVLNMLFWDDPLKATTLALGIGIRWGQASNDNAKDVLKVIEQAVTTFMDKDSLGKLIEDFDEIWKEEEVDEHNYA